MSVCKVKSEKNLFPTGRRYKAIDGRKNMTSYNVLFALCNKSPTRQTEANSGIIVKCIIDLFQHSSLELTMQLLGNLRQVPYVVLGDYVFVLYLEGWY
jgi:hypothetical protein